MDTKLDDYSPTIPVRTKLDDEFAGVAAGKSAWFPDGVSSHQFRLRFYRWRRKAGVMIDTSQIRVGDDDPRGAGYRIIFRSK